MIGDYVKLDDESAQPLYLQIRDGLRESIRLGHLKPGEALPTERAIGRDLQVSVGIVRQAMSLLVDEGLVYRRPQRGTFVARIDPESLKRVCTKTIGVVFVNLAGSFMASILKGIDHELRGHDYHMIICDSSDSIDRERSSIESLIERNVDGFIAFPVLQNAAATRVPVHYKRLVQASIPLVLVDCYLPKLQSNYVTFDNYGGAYAVTRHLIEEGHTRIAHISNKFQPTSLRDRMRGYAAALTDSGLPFEQELVEMYDPREGTLEVTVDRLLQQQVTAIFCYSDAVTYRVCGALQRRKLRVPSDIELAGFGTTDGIELIYPKLTTVAIPSFEMGRRAAEILIEAINNRPQGSPKQVVLQTELLSVEALDRLPPSRELAYA